MYKKIGTKKSQIQIKCSFIKENLFYSDDWESAYIPIGFENQCTYVCFFNFFIILCY